MLTPTIAQWSCVVVRHRRKKAACIPAWLPSDSWHGQVCGIDVDFVRYWKGIVNNIYECAAGNRVEVKQRARIEKSLLYKQLKAAFRRRDKDKIKKANRALWIFIRREKKRQMYNALQHAGWKGQRPRSRVNKWVNSAQLFPNGDLGGALTQKHHSIYVLSVKGN